MKMVLYSTQTYNGLKITNEKNYLRMLSQEAKSDWETDVQETPDIGIPEKFR